MSGGNERESQKTCEDAGIDEGDTRQCLECGEKGACGCNVCWLKMHVDVLYNGKVCD